MNYARLILPLAVQGPFTYRIPPYLQDKVQIGSLVVVQFAKRRHYVGLVIGLDDDCDLEEVKELIECIDDLPTVPKQAESFWNWIANYYLCTPGEVLNAALPSGLKLDHKLWVTEGPEFHEAEDLPMALQLLPEGGITLDEMMTRLGDEFRMNHLNHWIREGILELRDAWSKRKHALGEKIIERATDEDGLHHFLNTSSAPRQKELLLHFLHLQESQDFVRRKDLCPQPYSSTLLKAVLDKGILKERLLDPQELPPSTEKGLQALSADQLEALTNIQTGFAQKKPCLLYGVTSSGKTEIYTHLIQEALGQGKQALFLLPEIALTTQMIMRMQKCFGNRVLTYHSKMPDQQRVAVWKRIARGDEVLVLGARSALLLPFQQLHLIVVDEEHEPTYKQQDPAPRYHARDAAIYYGQKFHCQVLLGSATPSVESMENAEQGRFHLVRLHKRFGDHPLPKIQLLNTAGLKEGDEGLSTALVDAIRNQLNGGRQVILFQNRRGFSPYVICEECGEVPGCPNCDISLSFHRFGHQLRCHYCGHREAYPETCRSCRKGKLVVQGIGTQRLEAHLKELFPEAGIERLDVDSTKGRDQMQQLIDRFEGGQTQILIGTQMVTKGLDFRNVGLVGVISADSLLSIPDFRTYERCYQLIAQVSGRAGRGPGGGEVLIQSKNTSLDILKNLRDYEYDRIYDRERFIRQNYHYPPFTRLLRLVLAHPKKEQVEAAARHLTPSFQKFYGKMVLGPEAPTVGRLKNRYLQQFLIKIPKAHQPNAYKKALLETLEHFKDQAWMKGVRILIDVDPMQ